MRDIIFDMIRIERMTNSLLEREYIERIEILPANIGELAASEAAPLLERAALRIGIIKPKDEFWEGMTENLRGAASYIKAEKAKLASKTFRAISGASLVGTMVAACARPPESPIALTPLEPTTEVSAQPTASPEFVNSLNESAQKLTDEAFAGLGIHDVSLIGAGTLKDASGREFALFTSKLPDVKEGQDLDFLLLGQVTEANQVGEIKGLVIDEEKAQGPILEFIGVSFNPETQKFLIEGPSIRTNTQTGKIEVFKDGIWQELRGPDATIDEIQERLGPSVLAAPALPTPTAEVVEPSYQLEDGTQLERVEEGQLVDLFPGSEVFMSERGDIVIINEETGLELAGQKVETKYGSFTLLISRSHFQFLYKEHFGETTELGGYPNFSDSHLREEISRIISTLIQLKENEISVGSVNLATYEPKPKDFVAIFANPGATYQLADSLPEGMVDPENVQNIVSLQVGFPTLKTEDGQHVFIRMVGAPGYHADELDPNMTLEKSLGASQFILAIGQLVSEASASQGTGDMAKLFGPYDLISKSVYSGLFSNEEIKTTFGGLPAAAGHEEPYVYEDVLKYFEYDLGANGIIKVDFEKFK